MATSEQERTNNNVKVIELDEEVEGDGIGTKNYRFSKIGEPVPIGQDIDSEFDPENVPLQPLAVSERFHLLFVAYTNGFCVARTQEVSKSAVKKAGPSIRELSIVDVPIGKVSILALSAESSILAASVGSDLFLFAVSALVNKEKKPSFSCSVDSSCIKDIRWNRKSDDRFVVLTSDGKLYYGVVQDPLKDIMDNIDAVDWSVKGKFLAVANKNNLSILSSKFKKKLSMLLLFKSLIGDSEVNSSIKVDSISWVRPDCIIVGCFQLTDDGVEENYVVQVITSKDAKITDISSKPLVLSFDSVFLGFDPDVPSGIGPNMFLRYLRECDLALVANRKNKDQHIVLFSWSFDDQNKKTAMIEILNDAWHPRIDSQGNGDDNLILGLCVDKVVHSENIQLLLGDEEKEVSPSHILSCLTVDGKLSMFYFASASGTSSSSEDISVVSDDEENISSKVPSDFGEQSVEQVGLDFALTELVKNTFETKEGNVVSLRHDEQPHIIQKISTAAPSHGVKSHERIPTESQEVKTVNSQTCRSDVKQNQSRDGQQFLYLGQQVTALEGSSPKPSQLDGPIPGFKDFGNKGTQKPAVCQPSADSFSGKLASNISGQSLSKDLQKGVGMGMKSPGNVELAATKSASSLSWAGGKFSAKTSDERFSLLPQGGVEKIQFGNSNTSATAASAQIPGGLSDTSDLPKGPSTTVSSYIQKASIGAGNIDSALHSPQLVSQGSGALGKSNINKFQATKDSYKIPNAAGLLKSEPNLSKQFRNVEEMIKELDVLLQRIEGDGGFKDASITLLGNSVLAVEEGLQSLSDRCRVWKGTMDEQLTDVQLLSDKIAKVSARTSYFEKIVEQFSDHKYWHLWNFQKLDPEMEMTRWHILELHQDVTNQLIDLGRHFNRLELNKFGENGGGKISSKAFQRQHGPSRKVQSLHSLHNTMNAQLAAAEQLSECLSKQMAVLSIESPSKKKNVKKELFETIGIPYDGSFTSPDEGKAGNTLGSKKFIISSSSTAARNLSRSNQSIVQKVFEPETVRRRRDSLDQSWASYAPAKTTVKRTLLQEDRPEVSTSGSSLSMDKQHLKLEGSPVGHRKLSTAPSSSFLPTESKGILSSSPGTQVSPTGNLSLAKSASQLTPVVNMTSSMGSSFFTAEASKRSFNFSENPDSFVINEKINQQSGTFVSQAASVFASLPAQTLAPLKMFDGISDSSDKVPGVPKPTLGNVEHRPVIDQGAGFESLKSGESLLSPARTINFSTTLSGKAESSFGNTQPAKMMSSFSTSLQPFLSLSSPTIINSSSTSPSSLLKVTAETSPPVSAGWMLTSSKTTVDGNQTVSSTSSALSSLISTSSTQVTDKMVPSSRAPSTKLTSETPKTFPSPPMTMVGSKLVENSTQPSLEPKFGLQSDAKSAIQASSSQPEFSTGTSISKLEFPLLSMPMGELSTTQSGSHTKFTQISPQPDVPPDSPDVNLSASVLSTSTSKSLTSPQSSTQDSIGGLGSAVSKGTLSSAAEKPPPSFDFPSAAPLTSGNVIVKNGNEAVVTTQEDEMEEEAPESSQLSEVTLGNFGGFGLGSTSPGPTVPKSNPFGFSSTAAYLTSSPFTMTVPSGEIFRPASLSFQPSQPVQSSQPTNFGSLSGGFGTGITNQMSTGSEFGHPAQIGSGQQALGSVLGSFGQSRQLGAGLPGSGVGSTSSFSGGFAGQFSAGGFSGAATGNGFAGVASSGGGFSGLASGGGGFAAAAATAVGGFAAAATGSVAAGGGFAAAATPAGGGFGFAAAASGVPGGGFGGFGSQQGTGGFSGFGGTTGTARPPSQFFTQMRK